jgi:putative transposase
MSKSRCTEEQINRLRGEHDRGRKTAEICRGYGISERTFYRWKARYGGMEVSEARRLRQLEDETHRMKRLIADQALHIQGPQSALGRKP